MPRGVLETAGRDVDDVEVRLAVEHVGKRVVRLDLVLLGGLIGAVLVEIANSDEVGKLIGRVATMPTLSAIG